MLIFVCLFYFYTNSIKIPNNVKYSPLQHLHTLWLLQLCRIQSRVSRRGDICSEIQRLPGMGNFRVLKFWHDLYLISTIFLIQAFLYIVTKIVIFYWYHIYGMVANYYSQAHEDFGHGSQFVVDQNILYINVHQYHYWKTLANFHWTHSTFNHFKVKS